MSQRWIFQQKIKEGTEMTNVLEAFNNAILADAAYVGNLELAITPGALKTALSTRMTPDLVISLVHGHRLSIPARMFPSI
jgi:hypothetical protein